MPDYPTRSSSPLKARGPANGSSHKPLASTPAASSSSQVKPLSLVEKFRLQARQKLEKEEAAAKAEGPGARARAPIIIDDDSDDDLPGELNFGSLMAGARSRAVAKSSPKAGPSRLSAQAKSRSRSSSVESKSSSTASLEYPDFGSDDKLPSSTPSGRARRSVAKVDKYSFRPKMVKPREETLLRLETQHSAAVKVGLRSAHEIAAANYGKARRGSPPLRGPNSKTGTELGQAWDTAALIRARKRDRRMGVDVQGMTELDLLIEKSMRAFEEMEDSTEDELMQGDGDGSLAISRGQRQWQGQVTTRPVRFMPWEDSADEDPSESDSESETERREGDRSTATIKPKLASPSKAVKHAHFDLPEEEEEEEEEEEKAAVIVGDSSSQDRALEAVEKALMESSAPMSSPTKRKGKRSRNADEDQAGGDADELLRILKKDRMDLRAAQSGSSRERSLAWRRGRFPIFKPSPPPFSAQHPIQALLQRIMAAGGEVGLSPGSLSDAPRLASQLSSGLLALYDTSDDAADDAQDAQKVVSLARWLFELGVHAKGRMLGQAAVTGLHHLCHSPCAAKQIHLGGVAAPLRTHVANAILGEALPDALHRLGAKPALLNAAYGRDRPALAPVDRTHRHGSGTSSTPKRLESEGRARSVERILSVCGLLAAHVDVERARKASVAIAWLAADGSVQHLAAASALALQALTARALDQRPLAELEDFGLGLEKLDGPRQVARVVQILPSLTLRQRIVRSCAASLALLGPTAFSTSSERLNHDAKALVPLHKMLDALDSTDPSVNPFHISLDAATQRSGKYRAAAARGTDYALLEDRVELMAIALADVPLQLSVWAESETGSQPLQTTRGGESTPQVIKEERDGSRWAPQPRNVPRGLGARQAVRQALADLEAQLQPASDDGDQPASPGGGSVLQLRFSASRLGLLEKLVEKLHDINGRIHERGGSKLERTRVKDKLMRLALTIHYRVEAIVGSDNVGGGPSTRSGPRKSDVSGLASGKKQGRQSTLFESFANVQPKVEGGMMEGLQSQRCGCDPKQPDPDPSIAEEHRHQE